MKKKAQTIQLKLFITYSVIIIIVFSILVALFNIWTANQFKKKDIENYSNLTDSFQQNLDSEIEKMNSISSDILYSNLVKERFDKYITFDKLNGSGELTSNQINTEAINNTLELIDTLIAINGPTWSVQQINLYDFYGKVFGVGFDNRRLNIRVQNKDWYEKVMRKNGKKFITLPYKDPDFTDKATRYSDKQYISLCRIYFDKYNVPQGIVEVKQYYDIIFKNIIDYMSNSENQERVFVYDRSGNLVYPFEDKRLAEANVYYRYSQNTLSGKTYLTEKNPVTKEKELIQLSYSEFTGWMTIVVISEEHMLSSLHSFTELSVIVAIVILFLSLLLSFLAAKQLTTPISRLLKSIRSLDWQEISASTLPKELNSGFNEMEELNDAFQKMNSKLKQSMEDLLMSQSHEMQAKMLALQSQMNPHFLYNTLMTISAMAEENLNEHVITLCENVSDMLRYISSDRSPLVEMQTELEYTRKYLECMTLRYGKNLTYSIEIEESMKKFNIPKLVIQPLVENAIKYGVYGSPPWHIRIFGYQTHNIWQVSIRDTGPGFSSEEIDRIIEKSREIDRTNLMPSLELDGMGLLNIYVRLKLEYQNQAIFVLANHPEGGAFVTIGGEIR
ncbi:MAG TPA: histidine kinase [Ruminiclostridium sp.]